MKIVDNLIKSPLIYLLIGFLIIEFLIFISLFFTFYSFLENNEEIIKNSLLSQSDEIFNSISYLINSQLNSVSQELLLFNQHINIKQAYNLSESKYEKQNNICEIINSKSAESQNIFNIIDSNDETRSEKIDSLLKKEYLNKIALYTPNSNFEEYINSKINNKNICYAVSFLKSLFIKNVISNQHMEKINYTLFINDIILFYPLQNIDDNTLKALPFYNKEKCPYIQYKFECSSILDYKPTEGGLTLKNSIIYMNLKIILNNLYINTCLKSDLNIFSENSKIINDKNNYFCISTNLSNILEDINYDSNYFTFNIIQYDKKKDKDRINVLYSSNDNIYKDISLNKGQNINDLFTSDEYADYQLNKNSQENVADLFHILYYEIEKYNIFKEKTRQELIDEYQTNIKDIIDIIKNKQNNQTIIINVTQSYLYYDYNNKGKIDHNYSSIREDEFMYILRPIETDMVKIIEGKNIVDKSVKKILFYTLTVAKIIKPKRSLVYIIHNYISLRTFFYSLALEAFICVIIYIFLFYMMRCILNPLKVFKANLEKLLDNNIQAKDDDYLIRHKLLNENNIINKGENKNGLMSIKNYMLNYFKVTSKSEHQYTNKEMKEIENIVNFLEKILLLRDTNTSYQAKGDFYQSISSEISKKYELDLFRCQLLIAEYYIKDKEYTKAKQELENFQIRLEQCRAEFINKDKFNEKKNAFISTYNNSYINNFTDNKSIQKDKFIRLEMITENFHYLMGLTNYFLFLELKLQKKEIINELNNSKSNANKNIGNVLLKNFNININNGIDANSQTNKIIAQMDYHLEKAIKHFKESFKINNIFNINQIKNIIILVYLSKCYIEFSSKSVEESNRVLKRAFLSLSNFNQFLIELTDSNTLNFNKKKFNNKNHLLLFRNIGYMASKIINDKKCYIDSRVMLIVNGTLIQLILYQIGKIAIKMHKVTSAYFCFVKLIQISVFKNENIHFRAIKWLRYILSNQVNNSNSKLIWSKMLQFQSKRKSTILSSFGKIEEEENYIKKSSIEYMKDYLKNMIEIFEKNKYKRREKKISKELLALLEKKIDFNLLSQRASLKKRSRANSKFNINVKQLQASLTGSNNINQSNEMQTIKEDISQSSPTNKSNNLNFFPNNNNQNKISDDIDIIPRSEYESITKSFIMKDLLIAQIIHSPIKIREEEKTFKNIEKQYFRLNTKKKSKKCLIIILSDQFLSNFSSLKSFNLLIQYCINKFLDDKDKVGYIFYSSSSGIPDKFYELETKGKALKKLDELFIGINTVNKNKKQIKKKKYLTDSFETAMEMFNNEQLNNEDDIENKTDKYIFCFGMLGNLRYKSFEASFSQTNRINYMEISLYYFVFDSIENNQDKIIHYKKYFKKFIEGFLIFAENFKLIKLCFANICIEGKQKNIFSNKLECIKNII